MYDDYSVCPSGEQRKSVRVNVDWSLFEEEVPTGMTVMVFPKSGGAPRTVLTNDITHADFSLEPGSYSAIVFNQSTTEFGTLAFQGMDSYHTARVIVQSTTSQWYSRSDDEQIAVEPEWFAAAKCDDFEVLADSTEISMSPRSVICQVDVQVDVRGISSLRYARGSLTGISKGVLLGAGKPVVEKVTYLLEKWTKTIDKSDPSQGVLNTSFRCFGLPDGHHAYAKSNQLSVSALLVDNKTQIDNNFEVGDKFESEDKPSFKGYIIPLKVKADVSSPLPEVKPSEEGSGGGFDIKIDEWGKPEDIDMEI